MEIPPQCGKSKSTRNMDINGAWRGQVNYSETSSPKQPSSSLRLQQPPNWFSCLWHLCGPHTTRRSCPPRTHTSCHLSLDVKFWMAPKGLQDGLRLSLTSPFPAYSVFSLIALLPEQSTVPRQGFSHVVGHILDGLQESLWHPEQRTQPSQAWSTGG